jgi:hypothetical protein
MGTFSKCGTHNVFGDRTRKEVKNIGKGSKGTEDERKKIKLKQKEQLKKEANNKERNRDLPNRFKPVSAIL